MNKWWITLLLWLAFFVILSAVFNRAHAHDIYTQLRSPSGQLCCGGDDCEAIPNYRVNIDQSAVFHSRRWNADILISAEKITWLPVPGGEANEAHWCGNSRQRVSNAPIDASNPDPAYWTYCAFIAPGGM